MLFKKHLNTYLTGTMSQANAHFIAYFEGLLSFTFHGLRATRISEVKDRILALTLNTILESCKFLSCQLKEPMVH